MVNRTTLRGILTNPIGALFFFVGGWLWAIFGVPYERREAKRDQQKLAQDVRRDVAFLFKNDHAEMILPPEGARIRRPAIVVVKTGGLLFRFMRGRGDLGLDVSPDLPSPEWHDVPLVLSLVAPSGNIRRTSTLWHLSQVERILEINMSLLKSALSPEEYADLKDRLGEIYEQDWRATRRLEAEINRTIQSRR